MGHLMMDSKGWPYDSFDCLSFSENYPIAFFWILHCLVGVTSPDL